MIVYIAGMHRSGTSLVARLLNLCGVYLGEERDLVPAAEDNPEGFWENKKFQSINNGLLNAFGGSWDYPPTIEPGWEMALRLVDLRERASSLILEFSQHEVCGWKDPRNSLTYPFWKPLISGAKVVYCLRNPYAVSQSLQRRGYSTDVFAYQLWLAYNKQLLSTTKPEERIITHFDSFFFDPQSELRRLVDFIGLDVSNATIQQACEAISTKLRHTRASLDELYRTNAPEELITIYKELCLLAGPVFHLSLSSDEQLGIKNIGRTNDNIRDMAEYAQLISSLRLENRNKEKEIDDLNDQIGNLNDKISNLNDQIEGHNDQIYQLDQKLKFSNQEIVKLHEHMNVVFNSRKWRVASLMERVRLLFIPRESTREKIYYWVITSLIYLWKLIAGIRDGGIRGLSSFWGKIRSIKKREGFRGLFSRLSQKINSKLILSYSHKNAVISYDELLRTSYSSKQDDFVDLAPNDVSVKDSIAKLIAFYLPQFHPIPENDLWWGKGFTEWANVSKAVPQFVGHYQPHLPGELGFYDLRIPEVQKRQIELAKKYGIYGFAFHYYWFNGKRLLEKPLDIFLDSKENFPFCICWANENWTRRWDGLESEILIEQAHSPDSDLRFIEDIAPILKDERYICVNNRPLLIVYRANILPNVLQTVSIWREYCKRHGIGDPYLVAAQTFWFMDPREIGFDAAVEFPPHNVAMTNIVYKLKFTNQNYSGMVFDYREIIEKSTNTPQPDYKVFKTIFPGWDNEARKPGQGKTFAFSTPELYKEWLMRTMQKTMQESDPDKRLIFINAWNEWAEGAHLEPDRKYGYAYLQATADALIEIKNGTNKIAF